jgi:outer membrane protein
MMIRCEIGARLASRASTRTALFAAVAGILMVGGTASAVAQKIDTAKAPNRGEGGAIGSGYSLAQVLAATYSGNPTILAQRAALRATDEEIPQALSNWRPTVTVNESFSVSAAATDLPLVTTTRSDRVDQNINLSVSQPIFRGFRTLNQTARARNDIEAARAALHQVEQTTLLSAVEAFTAVVRDTAVVDLSRNNERVLERQLEAASNRFEVGELTRTDVAQAESRVASARAGRIAAEGTLVSSQAEFERVVGSPASNLGPAGGVDHLLPTDLAGAVAAARTENPNVRASRYREMASRENVDLIEGELLPSLTLNGSVSHNRQLHSRDTDVTSGSVTASLRVPLYQSGSVFSRVRQAKQIASQRMLELAGAEREAVRQATENWEGLLTARARIVSFASEVSTQTIALEGVTQESQVGARTVLDELDAEQELLDAQVNLVRAQRDEVVAAYRLLAAVGLLTAEDLALPVDIYDPTRNLRRVDHRSFGTGVN